MFRNVLLAAFALALVSPADARLPSGGGEIQISSQRSTFVRLPGDGDLSKAQDDVIKLLYRLADRECALVLETIGSSCEIVSINTNVSLNDSGERTPTVRGSAGIGLKVRLKSQ